MAQSKPHHFLARASDSGEDLTGLVCFKASAGIAGEAGAFGVSGAAVFCWAAERFNPKKNRAGRTSVALDTGTSNL
jgi:hypothetical protein